MSPTKASPEKIAKALGVVPEPKPEKKADSNGVRLIDRIWIGYHRSFQRQFIHIEAPDQATAQKILEKWCLADTKRGRPLWVKPFIEVDQSYLEEGSAVSEKTQGR